jgi:hypothetical protein
MREPQAPRSNFRMLRKMGDVYGVPSPKPSQVVNDDLKLAFLVNNVDVGLIDGTCAEPRAYRALRDGQSARSRPISRQFQMPGGGSKKEGTHRLGRGGALALQHTT